MEFERGLSGYRKAQVRAFLERVAAEREELLKELQNARDQAAEQQRRIETLEAAEADLRQAVIAAERVGTQMKDNARYEARLLVEEARAQRLSVDADIGRLRALRDDFRERFRAMLAAYERSLDATSAVLDGDASDSAVSEDDLHEDDAGG
jgi:cell division initiation protein